MGCYIRYSEEGTGRRGRGRSPAQAPPHCNSPPIISINGPLYSNTMVGTLALDWVGCYIRYSEGLGGAAARPAPPHRIDV